MSTFQIPKSKASIKQNRFEFAFPDEPDKTYSIPLLKYLKPSLGMKLGTVDKAEALGLVFDAYFPGEDLADRFEDGSQLEAFMEAWTEASGVTLGESEGSADS